MRASPAGNLNRRRLGRGWSLREQPAGDRRQQGTAVPDRACRSQSDRRHAGAIADVRDTGCTDLLRRPLLRPEINRASSLDGPDEETSVNRLFADHELGRIEICRTRPHLHAQSRISSHGADSVEYVLVTSDQGTLVVDDVPYLPETGDAAHFSGLSSHYCTTRDSPAVTHTVVGYPRG
ncbi:XRE family transcriptional regulator [Streptomyces atratus]|uniref:XRE family transcriptional regulator n=1 Tax=Streptomyces atratus TaxID=1893 RepID=UPI00340F25F0